MRISFFIVFSLFTIFCYSQDYNWWNRKHNWDGVTHWHRYIIISPAYMGPNALPVPEFETGTLSNSYNLELALENHYSKGDNTFNLYSRLYLPIAKNKVGFAISAVPLEYYEMDTITRDIRKARDFDGKGIASGDIYFGTYIQLINDKEKFPDVMVSINIKTASGNNLAAARFSDTPGYFFDLSCGKTYKTKSVIQSIKPFGAIGFYSWQTNYDGYYQNDAFMYALGVDLAFSKFVLKNSWGGYVGYISDGDKPMVYRLSLVSKLKSGLNYQLRLQQGFLDNNHFSVRFSFMIKLGVLKKD